MGHFFSESDCRYHSQSRRNLSSHLLIAAHRNMDEWRRLMVEPSMDTPAYIFGRAAHVLCLEGMDAFEAKYRVGGPKNHKTGKTYGRSTRKFAEWATEHAKQGKEVITPEQFSLALKMRDSVYKHKAASKLLRSGDAEQVARTRYQGLPCQIRIDWLRQDAWIVDYKSTGDLMSFSTSVHQYGYMYQAAFYQSVAARVLGKRLPVYMIATEKSDSARTMVWRPDQNELTASARKNEQKILEISEEFKSINASRTEHSVESASAS